MTARLFLVSGFIAGVAFIQALHWLFKKGAPEATASTTCSHCECQESGHLGKLRQCPCTWTVKATKDSAEYQRIEFFKPMSLKEWMKYRGIEDAGGTP